MKRYLTTVMIVLFMISLTACKKNTENKTGMQPKDFAKSLDFSFFPAESTALGIIDIQSMMQVKEFKKMFVSMVDSIKRSSDIDLMKVKSIYAFLNVKDLKNNPLNNAAVIIDGLNLSKSKKMPKPVKVDKFEGVNINVFDDKTGYIVIDNKTIGGTIDSIKDAILLNKGKAKNLASTPKNNQFKEIIARLKSSQMLMVFVGDEKIVAEMNKSLETALKSPSLFVFKSFFQNFKSAGFGLRVDDKQIHFVSVIKSSKEGVNTVEAVAKEKIKQLKSSDLNNMLRNYEMLLTKSGIQIIKNVIQTLSITRDGDFLALECSLSIKDAEKIPEIIMMLSLNPALKGMPKK